MLLTEYDEVEAMELFREDGIREGIAIGREEERRNTESERKRADKAEAELNELLAWAIDYGYQKSND